MNVLSVSLKEGSNCVEVLPGADGVAVVIGGNVNRTDDRVVCPDPDMTWQDAAEGVGNGDTRLSPFDLELVEDQSPTAADFFWALEIEDEKSRGLFDAVAYSVDEAEADSRLLSEAVKFPDERRKKGAPHRRRHSDAA